MGSVAGPQDVVLPSPPPRRDRGNLEKERDHASQHCMSENNSEAATRRDVYGFSLDGKVDWPTYSAWQVCFM